MKGRLPVIRESRFNYGTMRVIQTGEGAEAKIGSFCSIAEGGRIMLGGHHRMDYATTFPFGIQYPETFGNGGYVCVQNRGNVVIGNDVWIGDNVVIMAGVTVGDGAVLGCNAIVTKDVEPYSIVAGNPAKFIRYRFSPEVIEQLLDIAWWHLPVDIIKLLVPYLMSPDVEDNLPKIKEIIREHMPTE